MASTVLYMSMSLDCSEFAQWPGVTYLSDLQEAVRRAKEAAGDKKCSSTVSARPSAPSRPGCSTRSRSTWPGLLGEGRVSSSTSAPITSSWRPSGARGQDATHLRYRVKRR